MRAPLLAAAAAVAALAGCHDLPALGTCGNGVAEEANGEACDDTAATETCTATCELRCTTAAVRDGDVVVGTGADGAERYCPDARYRCGADEVCRAPSGAFEPLGPSLPFDVAGAPVLGDVDGDGLDDLVGTSATNLYVRFASATAAPLGDVVIQEAPSSDAPYAIFDQQPARTDAARPDIMIAVPTEGVALLRSDGERFAPELDLAIPVGGDTVGLIARDPDPALGDVAFAVQARSATAAIGVARVPVPADPGVPAQVLPPCVGPAGQGGWRTVRIDAAPDRRAFVVVTARDVPAQPNVQPWHVCRYSHAGAGWALAELDVAPPTATSIALANLDGDACLELAVRTEPNGLAMFDAAGPACALAGPPTPLAIAGATAGAALLGAGAIVPGGADELVLADGVYRACTGAGDCGAAPAGTLIRAAAPTQVAWSAAAITDLNRDGAADVVAARAGEADVDVVRGGAAPNVYRANTAEPVASLVAGDFDGDRLGDVALVETSPPGDRVSVLFGTHESILGAPRAMSAFAGRLRIDRLTELHWIPSTRGHDGIDDLLVLDSAGTPAAGLVVGDAARLMTTPRFPPVATGLPLGGVAAGPFGSPDVEVLTVTGDQVMLYNVMANAWAPSVGVGVSLRPPIAALREGPGRARAAARGAGLRDVVVFGVRGAITRCQVTAAGPPLALRGVDADGDGADELAVLTEDNAGDRQLQLFRAADCSLAPVAVEALAGCVDAAYAGDRLVALCRIGAARPARGVFAVTPAGGSFVRGAEPLAILDGDGRFITAGDFDGDGVLDAAVGVHRGDAVNVQLLRQCAAHDTRRCAAP